MGGVCIVFAITLKSWLSIMRDSVFALVKCTSTVRDRRVCVTTN